MGSAEDLLLCLGGSWKEHATLSDGDLESFARRGFVVKRRAASVGVVQGALRRVNGGLLEPGAVSRTRSSGDPIICKKLGKDPALLATLFESDACLPWVGNFRAPASMSPSQL